MSVERQAAAQRFIDRESDQTAFHVHAKDRECPTCQAVETYHEPPKLFSGGNEIELACPNPNPPPPDLSDLALFAKTGVLPSRISDDEDSAKLIEVIICDWISGGARYENEMPSELGLVRRTNDGKVFTARYGQIPETATQYEISHEMISLAEESDDEPEHVNDQNATRMSRNTFPEHLRRPFDRHVSPAILEQRILDLEDQLRQRDTRIEQFERLTLSLSVHFDEQNARFLALAECLDGFLAASGQQPKYVNELKSILREAA